MYYSDLCEYYNVDALTAIKLGTRSKNRKPDLPGSKTCKPVSGLSFEEIWNSEPRDNLQSKFQFYKDLGSWMCFRQIEYRKDFNIEPFVKHINFNKEELNICEYGCGISIIVNKMIEQVNGNIPDNVKFHLVDVSGEHLEFAKWRLKKKAPKANIEFYEISTDNIVPKFTDKLDFISLLDVLEHVPNPYDIMDNLVHYSNKDAVLFETWIDVPEPGYADLQESVDERDKTLKYMDKYFPVFASGVDIRVRKYAG